MKVAWIGIVTALLATMALALPAQAQYPPPGGDVTISPSDATPSVGETITLNIVVSEETGMRPSTDRDFIPASFRADDPAPGIDADALLQAGPYSCTAGVAGGSGATVTPTSFTTSAAGAATLSLYTGTQPGTLTVSVACGTASGQLLLNVGGGTGATPTATTPGGTVAPPGPPDTGTGTGSDGVRNTALLLGIGLAAAGLLAAGGVATFRGKRR